MAQLPAVRSAQLAPRRSGPSPLVAKLKDQVAATRSSMARYRREVRESAIPSALMEGGVVLAGAGALGVIEAVTGSTEFMGVPIAAAGALVLGTAGATMGQPLLIHAAAGFAAPWVYGKAGALASQYLAS